MFVINVFCKSVIFIYIFALVSNFTNVGTVVSFDYSDNEIHKVSCSFSEAELVSSTF